MLRVIYSISIGLHANFAGIISSVYDTFNIPIYIYLFAKVLVHTAKYEKNRCAR